MAAFAFLSKTGELTNKNKGVSLNQELNMQNSPQPTPEAPFGTMLGNPINADSIPDYNKNINMDIYDACMSGVYGYMEAQR